MNNRHVVRPFPNDEERTRLEQTFNQIDEAARQRDVAARPMTPPAYGEPQRDAIASVVDSIVRDVTEKINTVRKQLDALEQQVLTGAANAKASLIEQIAVSIRVNDEITHMGDVIDEIAKRFSDDR